MAASWCGSGIWALDLRLTAKGRGFDLRPFRVHVTTLGKLFTRTCISHQAVHFGADQAAVTPCGWGGNRRSGVAMAMLRWFIHLRAHGLRKGNEQPACLHSSWGKKIGKGSPYSSTERRVPELIPVLGSQPAGDVNHKPDGRLPLLSARPAVTPATLKRFA